MLKSVSAPHLQARLQARSPQQCHRYVAYMTFTACMTFPSPSLLFVSPAYVHCTLSTARASDHVCCKLHVFGQEWARTAKQEEEMLLKMKAASMSGSPCMHTQDSLTDKHGRLKQGNERASQHAVLHGSADATVQKQKSLADTPVV